MSILNFIAYDRENSIKFYPLVNRLTKNSNASLFLLKVLYYAAARQNEPFYKFRTPPEKPHPLYREDDSWTETLEISPKEFDTARDTVATRVKKGMSRSEIIRTESIKSLVLYWIDDKNTTWYQLNPLYARVFFDITFDFDIFKGENGKKLSPEEILYRITERAILLESTNEESYYPTSDTSRLNKGNELPKFEIDGINYSYKMVKAPLSEPNLMIPQLLKNVPMHDDFTPTAEMIDYAKKRGFTDEQIRSITVNTMTYWKEKGVKRAGWWRTWYDSLVRAESYGWNKGGQKNGGTGKGGNGLNASERKVEQLKQEYTTDLFSDVTD